MTETLNLADASVYINDELVPYVPGSLKATAVKGEIKTRALATGGGGVVLVSGLDSETMLDKISFQLPVTTDALDRAAGWKTNSINGAFNTVRFSWFGHSTIRSYTQVRMDNSPEAEHSAEGNFDVEMTGLRSIE